MRLSLISLIAASLIAAPAIAAPGSVLLIHSNYTAEELLSPCQEADNDARWGQAAEIECEQYIIGFVDALEVTGAVGEGKEICLPEQNIPDEVRWAFMRWVHADFTTRKAMMAGEALMATMKQDFPCKS